MRPYAMVTPAEVKAVYEALGNPTVYQIAKRFTQAGRPITRHTVKRWKASGWKPDRCADARSKALANCVPLLTRNPNTQVTDLVPPASGPLGVEDGVRATLEAMDHDNLTVESNRQVHITAILLSKEIQRQGPELVEKLPQQTGALLQAIAMSLAAANTGLEKLRIDAMKTIVSPPAGSNGAGHSIHDPLAAELDAWGLK